MKKFAIVIIAASAAVLALSSCAGTYQKGRVTECLRPQPLRLTL